MMLLKNILFGMIAMAVLLGVTAGPVGVMMLIVMHFKLSLLWFFVMIVTWAIVFGGVITGIEMTEKAKKAKE